MIQKDYKAPKHFTEKELRSQIKRSCKLMFSGWIIVMVGVVGFPNICLTFEDGIVQSVETK